MLDGENRGADSTGHGVQTAAGSQHNRQVARDTDLNALAASAAERAEEKTPRDADEKKPPVGEQGPANAYPEEDEQADKPRPE